MTPGTVIADRFVLAEELGRGAMGIVYGARDLTFDEPVAVKTLGVQDPLYLYLLKQEYRARAHLRHPGLVGLRALVEEDGSWFLVMDRVDGPDWLQAVRGDAGDEAPLSETRTLDPDAAEADAPFAPRPASTLCDPEVLRPLLAGLVEAVAALHAGGRLHRDLKPGNVRVRGDGRVVLLDFGLSVAGDGAPAERVGTAAWMAPEQAEGQPATEASDWYAVGAMLFAGLTGQPPFRGGMARVLTDKRFEDAPPVRSLSPDAPADLARLCDALLARDPADRPGEDAVCAALGLTAPLREDRTFIGRDAELAALGEAWEAVLAGEPAVCWVSGVSGIGKSALVDAFLGRVRRDRADAVVLRSRCHELEEAPYKAIDPLVDDLSRWLATLPGDQVEAWLPTHVRQLAARFPALDRLAAVRRVTGRSSADATGADLALRELLQRLAERRPVVVAVDDAQWMDADSLRMLTEALRPPWPPPMLLLFGSRGAPLAALTADTPVREVALGPLDAAAGLALARAGVDDAELAGRVVHLAGGSPLYVNLLARTAAVEGRVPSLDKVIERQLDRLPEAARALLVTVACAPRAVPVRDALAVARSLREEVDFATAATLRHGGLITHDAAGHLQCVHDRIRETATRATAALARAHRAWLDRLPDDVDPDVRLVHAEGADDPDAVREAVHAALDHAEASGAVRRAVTLLRRALELCAADDPGRPELLARLGQAELRAGEPCAADTLLGASRMAGDPDRALTLQAHSASSLAWQGRTQEFVDALPPILRKAGVPVPGWTPALYLVAFWQLLLARIEPRRPLSTAERGHLSLLRSLAIGSGWYSPSLTLLIAARAYRLARRSPDASERSWALATHALGMSQGGAVSRARALMDEAEAIALPDDDPSVGWRLLTRVVVELQDWEPAIPAAEAAVAHLSAREDRFDEAWCAQLFLMCHLHCGAAWSRFRDESLTMRAEARSRRAVLMERMAVAGTSHMVELGADDPAAAFAELDRLEAHPTQRFDATWLYVMLNRAQVHLYIGDHEGALTITERAWAEATVHGLMKTRVHRSWWGWVTAAAAAGLPPSAKTAAVFRSVRRRAAGQRGILERGLGASLDALALVDRSRDRAADALVPATTGTSSQIRLFADLSMAALRGDRAAVDAHANDIAGRGIADPIRFARPWSPLIIALEMRDR